MEGPLLAITAIAVVGLLFVIAPVMFDAYRKYRRRQVIICPETKAPAEITLDARRAAVGAAFGRTLIFLKGCSRWPKRKNCEQRCLK